MLPWPGVACIGRLIVIEGAAVRASVKIGGVLVVAAFALTGCMSSGGAAGSGQRSTGAAPSSGVSQGVGAKNASADVTVGHWTYDSLMSVGEVGVTVTNHSSKRSDYDITIALESPDGSQQYDTAEVFITGLEPGQTKHDTGDFMGLDRRPPSTARLVLQEVQRTASM